MSNDSVDFRVAKVLNSLPEVVEKDTVYLIRKDDGFDICVSNGIGELEVYDLNADLLAKEVGRRVDELDEHIHNDMEMFNNIIQGLSPVNLRVKSDVVTKVAKSDGEVQLTWEIVKQSNNTSIVEVYSDRVEFKTDGVFTFKTDLIIGRSGGGGAGHPMDLVITIKENDVVVETKTFAEIALSDHDTHVTFETVIDGAPNKVVTVFVSSDGSTTGTLDIKEMKSYMLSQSIGSALQIPEASEHISGITKYGVTAGTASEGNHKHSADDVTSGTLPVVRGGTGGTTASAARANLGLGDASLSNVVQETGGSETDVMSQKAVTDALDQKTDTTYSAMSVSEGDVGDSTTLRTMRSDYLRQIISKIPSKPQTAAYTAAAIDRGRSIDTTANVTIPSGTFSVGDVLCVTNTGGNDITIFGDSGVTLRKAGTTVTGTQTLKGYGVATLRMVTTNVWFVTGAGLS